MRIGGTMSARSTALSFLVIWAVQPAFSPGPVDEPPERVSSEQSLRVLAETLRSGTPGQARRSAAAALGRLGSEAAVPPLVGALEDEWEWVRVDAAAALGRIGGLQAAAGLVGALRDANWNVRSQARRALVAIGAPAVEPLARATADPDPGLRWRAAWALGRIGGDEAARVLEMMRADPDGDVRNEVAAAAERKSRAMPPLYPETLAVRPALPSPTTAPDGTDLVVMLTREGRWAVVPAARRTPRLASSSAASTPTTSPPSRGPACTRPGSRAVGDDHRPLARRDRRPRPAGRSLDGGLPGRRRGRPERPRRRQPAGGRARAHPPAAGPPALPRLERRRGGRERAPLEHGPAPVGALPAPPLQRARGRGRGPRHQGRTGVDLRRRPRGLLPHRDPAVADAGRGGLSPAEVRPPSPRTVGPPRGAAERDPDRRDRAPLRPVVRLLRRSHHVAGGPYRDRLHLRPARPSTRSKPPSPVGSTRP